MRFGELMEVFSGWRVRIRALGEDGSETVQEISLAETVNAHMKLAAYRDAKVERFATGTMEFEGQEYPALEVVVRV